MIANQPFEHRPEHIDLGAIWRVACAYKYAIALSAFIFGAIATVLALTSIPIFRAEAAIIEASTDNLQGAGAQLSNQLGGIANLIGVNLGPGSERSREYLGLLKSRQLVEEFIKRNDLQSRLLRPGAVHRTLWFAVRKFQNDVLAIREDKRSGLTMVDISWTDPATAANWANGIVALANELLRVKAMNEAKASIAYLNGQISQTNVVEIQRVMYGLIENETKTLMLANAKAEYAFDVVDPAVAPEVRSSPHRTLMVLLGLTIGVLIGLMGALAHNSWKRNRLSTQ